MVKADTTLSAKRKARLAKSNIISVEKLQVAQRLRFPAFDRICCTVDEIASTDAKPGSRSGGRHSGPRDREGAANEC
jgi:hypothetical protein